MTHSRGRVVVGVDGSPASLVAFRAALDEARRRGADLTAVIVHQPRTEPVGLAGGPARLDPHGEEQASTTLRRAAREIGAGEDVELVTTSGPPARALLRLAHGADLLVVGSRGRGGFAGLLLGSVSHQVVTHADVPVLVVPTGGASGAPPRADART